VKLTIHLKLISRLRMRGESTSALPVRLYCVDMKIYFSRFIIIIIIILYAYIIYDITVTVCIVRILSYIVEEHSLLWCDAV
jgi:hypothetical protein